MATIGGAVPINMSATVWRVTAIGRDTLQVVKAAFAVHKTLGCSVNVPAELGKEAHTDA